MEITQTEQSPPPLSPSINLDELEKLTEEEQAYLEEPVLALIGKDVTQMNHDELELHIKNLRAMRTGSDGIKTLLRLESDSIREKKPRQARKKKDVDMSILW